MKQQALGWGVIGTGTIARKFAEDMALVVGARHAAVCSRSMETGRAFASAHGFAKSYADLDEFLGDPSVEAVYVATPNTAHLEQALAVVKSGKPVLIEKPVALSAADARTIARAAEGRNVFAMEAMWTRFLPAVQRTAALIADGRIGMIERAQATLGFSRVVEPDSRLFNAALGGGVLYDLGVYPLSLALMLLGEASNVSGRWKAGPTGTDIEAHVEMTCGGAPVSVRTSFASEMENAFVIQGSAGVLRLDRHFLRGPSLTLWDKPLKRIPAGSDTLAGKLAHRFPLDGRRTERFDQQGHGLHHEIRAAQAAILSGKTSSDVMPLGESARVLEIIRAVLSTPAET
ncbi:Gfo/Idh/MocA family protein [Oricola cellulosilytica]|uniref:Gfo/Idh/MocA family oxidoreductase n=1 Tax=Oricola cellulosilytica TaxID=1429082 RepID=A0A4R0PIQ0_9HYPH|nr:Gfo/Idh/MocA family oxidoreductase [Oricola cellulosilytica]TCD16554.1 Gfo/Idh/MocA family oxidoreductase [Oricola cellulosilytica]